MGATASGGIAYPSTGRVGRHLRLIEWATSILPGRATSWTAGLLRLLLAALAGGLVADARRHPRNSSLRKLQTQNAVKVNSLWNRIRRLSVAPSVVAIAGPMVALAQGVEGNFGLAAMVHTHDWPNNVEVLPWDGGSNGEYVYRAIPCSDNAPMNNISSNLPSYNSMIPGSRSPASTRSHPFKFMVSNGKIVGSINLTVCKLGPGPTKDERPDAERDRILINF